MATKNIIEKAKEYDRIVAVGDVHGKTNELAFRIKERYKIQDSIIILCGDIGFGFNKPNYHNEKRLKEIENIDFVFTHAAPDFCEPILKDGIKGWLRKDWELEVDCDYERQVFTKIFNYLSSNNTIKWWVYGHYHLSRTQYYNNSSFRAIDELEFFEIPLSSCG